MAIAIPYPVQLDFAADRRITRWRPLVQWLLAIPHLAIANVLRTLRQVLTFISLFTVLFTKRIPRSLFDMIATTYRYEWRAFSYALFLHEDYPPFDFQPASDDDGAEPHTVLSIAYPVELNRWKPLYKWLFAVPHYIVLALLLVAGMVAFIGGVFAVLFSGVYPRAIRDFLVSVYRYALRVEAYVGLLTDEFPPFHLTA